MRFRVVASVGVLLSMVMFACAARAAVIGLEDFDAGIGTWVPNTSDTAVSHQATGGNPGGYLRSESGSNFPDIIGMQNQTAGWTGDYVAAGISGVTIDLDFMQGNFTDALLRFRSSASQNGWAIPLTSNFAGGWQSFSVAFDTSWSDMDAQSAGWVRSAPEVSFSTLWSGVFSAEIRLFGTGGASTPLIAGIDNFALTGMTVPEPSTSGLVLMALLMGGAFRYRRRD